MDPEGLAVQKKSVDLQTNACVTAARLVPKHQWEEALKNTLEEVVLRYYGCGLIIPEYLENCWILDLGSENGRDCYALKYLALFRLILLFLRGGELYFSDVYTSLELPEEIRTHKILWGRLPGGALYWKDFVILTSEIAFCPSRLVTANLIIHKKELERDLITDPFKLVEESDNMKSRCSPDVARGCCGTKKSC
ncbi:PREDICTED: LOW QUALITY PROTEIN: arsenite methyltransferase [Hipposideros armiger]|uniref:LOW QUALITY PROTEIN: arsenite methyltransferase n=1 Tax=Hipposideros armiger TaxID=186990 RepID=A0A8B7QSQ4_HIPAR|nr:PREDICTED: LOW QUALITY PROTEIN: arsenite methyltransferase [Hipposideros armiger]